MVSAEDSRVAIELEPHPFPVFISSSIISAFSNTTLSSTFKSTFNSPSANSVYLSIFLPYFGIDHGLVLG